MNDHSTPPHRIQFSKGNNSEPLLDLNSASLPADHNYIEKNSKKEGITMRIDWVDFAWALAFLIVIEVLNLHAMGFF